NDGVPPDSHKIQKHANTVPQKTDLASFRMTPTDRRLANGQAVALCEEQQFRVETKPGRGLLFEKAQRLLAIKKFETALGVVQPEAEEQTNHEIEKVSSKFAQARLMFFDVRAVDGSRADHHVGAFARCDIEKRIQFLDRRRQIGVG